MFLSKRYSNGIYYSWSQEGNEYRAISCGTKRKKEMYGRFIKILKIFELLTDLR